MATKTHAKTQSSEAKVFLVDDHPIVRQGLALLIGREADLVVCGEAEGGFGVLQTIFELQPDIVILDISLNGPDGLDILKTIRMREPSLPVLVLSMHDELTYAERALRAGANGYIMKQEATEKVLIAIRRILKGEVYLSDRLTNRMLQHFVRGPVATPRARLPTSCASASRRWSPIRPTSKRNWLSEAPASWCSTPSNGR